MAVKIIGYKRVHAPYFRDLQPMLEHICNYCGKKQKARVGLKSVILEDRKTIHNDDDSCAECDDIADAAKKEALEKRKKKE